jgi:hypothetical protein
MRRSSKNGDQGKRERLSGLQTFMEIGEALLEIRDSRLYRANFKTFEEYCRERWKMSKPQAYRLVDAAEVSKNLSPIGDIQPTHESQVRPLQNGNRGKRERLKHRMTLAALSECLGIPTRTLYRYRRDFPDQVPKSFDLKSWIEFLGAIKNYPAERTRPRDRNGSESSAEEQNGEHGEFTVLAERRERILRLRLSNEMHRTKLERLRESTVTVGECEAVMSRIRAAVSGEILKLPASLAELLAGKDAAFIQMFLERALHKSLQALSRPEIY